MSSSNAMWVAAWLATVPLAAQQPKTTPVVCPASVTVHESIAPVAGWTSAAGDVKREFERISVFNGTSGGQEYDLAPDTEKIEHHMVTQTWNLDGYRQMNIFLRCRYHGTSAVLEMDLPAPLKVCTFHYQAAADGSVAAQAQMSCK